MISQTVKETLQQYVPSENILYEEPMKKHTTFKVGGNAAAYLEITDKVDLPGLLSYFSKVEMPYFITGNGSNLLVGDRGYQGVILHIADQFADIIVEGNTLRAKAGASMAKVARTAAEHGLTGMEFAAGIPGTVGGGVVMNAGAYDGEMKQVIQKVTVLDKEGTEITLSNAGMEFGYRTSAIKGRPFLVTECVFDLVAGDKEEILAKMADFQQRRKEKQPLEYPSAGSTFKRPPNNFAGKLIMDAGLRGYSVGGAQVSEKHCGFVINTGLATAEDVRELIADVQEKVYDIFSVHLEPEIIFLGEF